MSTNDVSKLSTGKVQYSCMCYDDGGIVDDLLVYHCGDYLQLVVNASNLEKDYNWLHEHLAGNVQLNDVSDNTSLLAVQGPKSLATMKKLTALDLGSLEYYHFLTGKVAGVDCLISRTGYTGELGFEVYFIADPTTGEKIWNEIFDAGNEFGIAPIGLGARDTLRLEVGFCLYGNDIDQTTNPLEANLGWITKLNKGGFSGREALLDIKEKGLSRKLVGLLVEGKSIPRHGYEIKVDGVPGGVITSGTMSPMLGRNIAMGYVRTDFAEPGSKVSVMIRNQAVPATVMKVPFIEKQ